ncbi:uncharacterized protein LOC134192531 [Corticium candelabrum]|uniref:uncharacterized protein LOC134192531 n=1 Tax=Corticium candelabrum TaxID=121492 RepID=UPI002E25F30B|nr:uncharacterized protein LOC134192531 [Corticium candelabrum]
MSEIQGDGNGSKQRLRKKQSRKRRRQEIAKARENEDESGSKNSEEINETVGMSASKKAIYTVAAPPQGWEASEHVQSGSHAADVTVESQIFSESKKQHNGLRCKKCFYLLCKDKDFRYHNDELWVASSVLNDKQWNGLLLKYGKVFCQKMHKVGSMQRTTHANNSILVPVLTVDKTTFRENFSCDSK